MKNKFNITTFFLLITFSTISYSQNTAIDSLKRVLKATKIDTSKVTIYNNLANNFKEINPDSTTYYATKAMILSQKTNYRFGLATSYINNGNANIILGNYKNATAYFNKAILYYNLSLKLYEEIQNKFGASLALYNLGQLYCDQKKYAEAMNFTTKSLAYAKEIGVLDQTFNSEKLLSELYEFQNNHEQSLVHFKNYIIAW